MASYPRLLEYLVVVRDLDIISSGKRAMRQYTQQEKACHNAVPGATITSESIEKVCMTNINLLPNPENQAMYDSKYVSDYKRGTHLRIGTKTQVEQKKDEPKNNTSSYYSFLSGESRDISGLFKDKQYDKFIFELKDFLIIQDLDRKLFPVIALLRRGMIGCLSIKIILNCT